MFPNTVVATYFCLALNYFIKLLQSSVYVVNAFFTFTLVRQMCMCVYIQGICMCFYGTCIYVYSILYVYMYCGICICIGGMYSHGQRNANTVKYDLEHTKLKNSVRVGPIRRAISICGKADFKTLLL